MTSTTGRPYCRANSRSALIVSRNGHDRAGAIAGQDIVGDKDRHRLAVDRIDGVAPVGTPSRRRSALSLSTSVVRLVRST